MTIDQRIVKVEIEVEYQGKGEIKEKEQRRPKDRKVIIGRKEGRTSMSNELKNENRKIDKQIEKITKEQKQTMW